MLEWMWLQSCTPLHLCKLLQIPLQVKSRYGGEFFPLARVTAEEANLKIDSCLSQKLHVVKIAQII